MPGELEPALPLTFAARRSGGLRIQLEMPHLARALPEGAVLRLRQDKKQLSLDARAVPQGAGHLLVAEGPSTGLTPGTWQLHLREQPDQGTKGVGAYLLVVADGPVCLLLGTPAAPGLITPPTTTRVQRVASAAGRAADVALSPLEPARADALRSKLRQSARKILG